MKYDSGCAFAQAQQYKLLYGKNTSKSMEARPRRALVIGIGKYGESELRNAENDAKSMAQQLKVKAGFEVTLLLNPNR